MLKPYKYKFKETKQNDMRIRLLIILILIFQGWTQLHSSLNQEKTQHYLAPDSSFDSQKFSHLILSFAQAIQQFQKLSLEEQSQLENVEVLMSLLKESILDKHLKQNLVLSYDSISQSIFIYSKKSNNQSSFVYQINFQFDRLIPSPLFLNPLYSENIGSLKIQVYVRNETVNHFLSQINPSSSINAEDLSNIFNLDLLSEQVEQSDSLFQIQLYIEILESLALNNPDHQSIHQILDQALEKYFQFTNDSLNLSASKNSFYYLKYFGVQSPHLNTEIESLPPSSLEEKRKFTQTIKDLVPYIRSGKRPPDELLKKLSTIVLDKTLFVPTVDTKNTLEISSIMKKGEKAILGAYWDDELGLTFFARSSSGATKLYLASAIKDMQSGIRIQKRAYQFETTGQYLLDSIENERLLKATYSEDKEESLNAIFLEYSQILKQLNGASEPIDFSDPRFEDLIEKIRSFTSIGVWIKKINTRDGEYGYFAKTPLTSNEIRFANFPKTNVVGSIQSFWDDELGLIVWIQSPSGLGAVYNIDTYQEAEPLPTGTRHGNVFQAKIKGTGNSVESVIQDIKERIRHRTNDGEEELGVISYEYSKLLQLIQALPDKTQFSQLKSTPGLVASLDMTSFRKADHVLLQPIKDQFEVIHHLLQTFEANGFYYKKFESQKSYNFTVKSGVYMRFHAESVNRIAQFSGVYQIKTEWDSTLGLIVHIVNDERTLLYDLAPLVDLKPEMKKPIIASKINRSGDGTQVGRDVYTQRKSHEISNQQFLDILNQYQQTGARNLTSLIQKFDSTILFPDRDGRISITLDDGNTIYLYHHSFLRNIGYTVKIYDKKNHGPIIVVENPDQNKQVLFLVQRENKQLRSQYFRTFKINKNIQRYIASRVFDNHVQSDHDIEQLESIIRTYVEKSLALSGAPLTDENARQLLNQIESFQSEVIEISLSKDKEPSKNKKGYLWLTPIEYHPLYLWGLGEQKPKIIFKLHYDAELGLILSLVQKNTIKLILLDDYIQDSQIGKLNYANKTFPSFVGEFEQDYEAMIAKAKQQLSNESKIEQAKSIFQQMAQLHQQNKPPSEDLMEQIQQLGPIKVSTNNSGKINFIPFSKIILTMAHEFSDNSPYVWSLHYAPEIGLYGIIKNNQGERHLFVYDDYLKNSISDSADVLTGESFEIPAESIPILSSDTEEDIQLNILRYYKMKLLQEIVSKYSNFIRLKNGKELKAKQEILDLMDQFHDSTTLIPQVNPYGKTYLSFLLSSYKWIYFDQISPSSDPVKPQFTWHEELGLILSFSQEDQVHTYLIDPVIHNRQRGSKSNKLRVHAPFVSISGNVKSSIRQIRYQPHLNQMTKKSNLDLHLEALMTELKSRTPMFLDSMRQYFADLGEIHVIIKDEELFMITHKEGAQRMIPLFKVPVHFFGLPDQPYMARFRFNSNRKYLQIIIEDPQTGTGFEYSLGQYLQDMIHSKTYDTKNYAKRHYYQTRSKELNYPIEALEQRIGQETDIELLQKLWNEWTFQKYQTMIASNSRHTHVWMYLKFLSQRPVITPYDIDHIDQMIQSLEDLLQESQASDEIKNRIDIDIQRLKLFRQNPRNFRNYFRFTNQGNIYLKQNSPLVINIPKGKSIRLKRAFVPEFLTKSGPFSAQFSLKNELLLENIDLLYGKVNNYPNFFELPREQFSQMISFKFGDQLLSWSEIENLFLLDSAGQSKGMEGYLSDSLSNTHGYEGLPNDSYSKEIRQALGIDEEGNIIEEAENNFSNIVYSKGKLRKRNFRLDNKQTIVGKYLSVSQQTQLLLAIDALSEEERLFLEEAQIVFMENQSGHYGLSRNQYYLDYQLLEPDHLDQLIAILRHEIRERNYVLTKINLEFPEWYEYRGNIDLEEAIQYHSRYQHQQLVNQELSISMNPKTSQLIHVHDLDVLNPDISGQFDALSDSDQLTFFRKHIQTWVHEIHQKGQLSDESMTQVIALEPITIQANHFNVYIQQGKNLMLQKLQKNNEKVMIGVLYHPSLGLVFYTRSELGKRKYMLTDIQANMDDSDKSYINTRSFKSSGSIRNLFNNESILTHPDNIKMKSLLDSILEEYAKYLNSNHPLSDDFFDRVSHFSNLDVWIGPSGNISLNILRNNNLTLTLKKHRNSMVKIQLYWHLETKQLYLGVQDSNGEIQSYSLADLANIQPGIPEKHTLRAHLFGEIHSSLKDSVDFELSPRKVQSVQAEQSLLKAIELWNEILQISQDWTYSEQTLSKYKTHPLTRKKYQELEAYLSSIPYTSYEKYLNKRSRFSLDPQKFPRVYFTKFNKYQGAAQISFQIHPKLGLLVWIKDESNRGIAYNFEYRPDPTNWHQNRLTIVNIGSGRTLDQAVKNRLSDIKTNWYSVKQSMEKVIREIILEQPTSGLDSQIIDYTQNIGKAQVQSDSNGVIRLNPFQGIKLLIDRKILPQTTYEITMQLSANNDLLIVLKDPDNNILIFILDNYLTEAPNFIHKEGAFSISAELIHQIEAEHEEATLLNFSGPKFLDYIYQYRQMKNFKEILVYYSKLSRTGKFNASLSQLLEKFEGTNIRLEKGEYQYFQLTLTALANKPLSFEVHDLVNPNVNIILKDDAVAGLVIGVEHDGLLDIYILNYYVFAPRYKNYDKFYYLPRIARVSIVDMEQSAQEILDEKIQSFLNQRQLLNKATYDGYQRLLANLLDSHFLFSNRVGFYQGSVQHLNLIEVILYRKQPYQLTPGHNKQIVSLFFDPNIKFSAMKDGHYFMKFEITTSEQVFIHFYNDEEHYVYNLTDYLKNKKILDDIYFVPKATTSAQRGKENLPNNTYSEGIQQALGVDEYGNKLDDHAHNFSNIVYSKGKLRNRIFRLDNKQTLKGQPLSKPQIDQLQKAIDALSEEARLFLEEAQIVFMENQSGHYGLNRNQYYLDYQLLDKDQLENLILVLNHEVQERKYVIEQLNTHFPDWKNQRTNIEIEQAIQSYTLEKHQALVNTELNIQMHPESLHWIQYHGIMEPEISEKINQLNVNYRDHLKTFTTVIQQAVQELIDHDQLSDETVQAITNLQPLVGETKSLSVPIETTSIRFHNLFSGTKGKVVMNLFVDPVLGPVFYSRSSTGTIRIIKLTDYKEKMKQKPWYGTQFKTSHENFQKLIENERLYTHHFNNNNQELFQYIISEYAKSLKNNQSLSEEVIALIDQLTPHPLWVGKTGRAGFTFMDKNRITFTLHPYKSSVVLMNLYFDRAKGQLFLGIQGSDQVVRAYEIEGVISFVDDFEPKSKKKELFDVSAQTVYHQGLSLQAIIEKAHSPEGQQEIQAMEALESLIYQWRTILRKAQNLENNQQRTISALLSNDDFKKMIEDFKANLGQVTMHGLSKFKTDQLDQRLYLSIPLEKRTDVRFLNKDQFQGQVEIQFGWHDSIGFYVWIKDATMKGTLYRFDIFEEDLPNQQRIKSENIGSSDELYQVLENLLEKNIPQKISGRKDLELMIQKYSNPPISDWDQFKKEIEFMGQVELEHNGHQIFEITPFPGVPIQFPYIPKSVSKIKIQLTISQNRQLIAIATEPSGVQHIYLFDTYQKEAFQSSIERSGRDRYMLSADYYKKSSTETPLIEIIQGPEFQNEMNSYYKIKELEQLITQYLRLKDKKLLPELIKAINKFNQDSTFIIPKINHDGKAYLTFRYMPRRIIHFQGIADNNAPLRVKVHFDPILGLTVHFKNNMVNQAYLLGHLNHAFSGVNRTQDSEPVIPSIGPYHPSLKRISDIKSNMINQSSNLFLFKWIESELTTHQTPIPNQEILNAIKKIGPFEIYIFNHSPYYLTTKEGQLQLLPLLNPNVQLYRLKNKNYQATWNFDPKTNQIYLAVIDPETGFADRYSLETYLNDYEHLKQSKNRIYLSRVKEKRPKRFSYQSIITRKAQRLSQPSITDDQRKQWRREMDLYQVFHIFGRSGFSSPSEYYHHIFNQNIWTYMDLEILNEMITSLQEFLDNSDIDPSLLRIIKNERSRLQWIKNNMLYTTHPKFQLIRLPNSNQFSISDQSLYLSSAELIKFREFLRLFKNNKGLESIFTPKQSDLPLDQLSASIQTLLMHQFNIKISIQQIQSIIKTNLKNPSVISMNDLTVELSQLIPEEVIPSLIYAFTNILKESLSQKDPNDAANIIKSMIRSMITQAESIPGDSNGQAQHTPSINGSNLIWAILETEWIESAA